MKDVLGEAIGLFTEAYDKDRASKAWKLILEADGSLLDATMEMDQMKTSMPKTAKLVDDLWKHWDAARKQIKVSFAEEAKKASQTESRLTEGTWAVPDTPEKKSKAEALVKQLEKWKKDAYNVLGDDELFDGIGNAIARAKKLIGLK